MRKGFTTSQVANNFGISYQTIHNWIHAGRMKPPSLVKTGKNFEYVWTAQDIAHVGELKGTLKLGRPRKKN